MSEGRGSGRTQRMVETACRLAAEHKPGSVLIVAAFVQSTYDIERRLPTSDVALPIVLARSQVSPSTLASFEFVLWDHYAKEQEVYRLTKLLENAKRRLAEAKLLVDDRKQELAEAQSITEY